MNDDDFYNSAEAGLDTVMGRNKSYWLRLKSAKNEYHDLSAYSLDGSTLRGFKHYMREVYGVAMESDSEGYTLPTYTILDEHKHLIFLLKHSKHEN